MVILSYDSMVLPAVQSAVPELSIHPVVPEFCVHPAEHIIAPLHHQEWLQMYTYILKYDLEL